LKRINVDGYDQVIAFFAGSLHETQMPIMQEAHRGDETYGRSVTFFVAHLGAQELGIRHGLHQ
jgi:hypothetical protein